MEIEKFIFIAKMDGEQKGVLQKNCALLCGEKQKERSKESG